MRRPWLVPFVPLYAAGAALHNLRIERGKPPARLHWPVISIGNLSTGGAGKTPLTVALARLLTGAGYHVDVLSRGYGREAQAALCVDPSGTAASFGDEPLLIAREAGVPVFVAPQRYAAGQLAEADFLPGPQGRRPQQSGPRVHILDDGFQHRQLHRDIDILLLNRADWHDVLLPAGNLREPQSAIRRATVIAIPADEPELEPELRAFGWQGPIWRLHRHMAVPPVDGRVAAFCGIARPEQFFLGLKDAGVQLGAVVAFHDHHPYTRDDLQRLVDTARRANATTFLTTEKDFIRLGDLVQALPASVPLRTVPLRVEIEDAPAALQWLIERLTSSAPRS